VRALVHPPLGSTRRLAVRLRDRAGSESRRRRIVWGVIALVLVFGPVLFNLARDSTFRASVEVFPTSLAPYRAALDPGYYRALLADPELRRQMRLNAHADISEYRDATLRLRTRRGPLVLTVASNDPPRARELVNALGPQLVVASRREVTRRATSDGVRLRRQLRHGGMGRSERRLVRRRIAQVERLLPNTPDPAVLGSLAPKQRLPSWADRVAEAMPGEFHPHGSAVASGPAC
jgi:hypothetical protein